MNTPRTLEPGSAEANQEWLRAQRPAIERIKQQNAAERAADEAEVGRLRERFEAWATGRLRLERSIRYPGQYACDRTHFAFAAFVAGARGDWK